MLRCLAPLLAPACLAPSAPAQIDGAVYPNNHRLREVFAAARQQRIALVGIGDSNQLYNANGWEDAWHNALAVRYSVWGTALLSAGESSGHGSAVGSGAATQPAAPNNTAGAFHFEGAPPELTALMADHPVVPPAGYLYIPPDIDTADAATQNGMVITNASGLNLNDRLRFNFSHALIEGGPNLHAVVSQGVWGDPVLWVQEFSNALPGNRTGSAETGEDHGQPAVVPAPIVTDSIDLPAAPRWWSLRLWFADERTRPRGPFFLTFMQAENPDNTKGAAVHTLFGLGGATARAMAQSLMLASDAQLSHFFERVRAPLGPSPRVIVRINSGVNDRGESLPSASAYITPGNSADAFRDNIDTILTRIRAVWDLNHWDSGAELSFLVCVSHPISSPDDDLLVRYRDAIRDLADRAPDVTAVDLSMLARAEELSASAWYQAPDDHYHLSLTGHRAVAERELLALIRSDCWEPADLDNSGEVSTRDLVQFLNAFGTPALTPGWGADLNADGVTDIQDLVWLLARFGSQTCNADG